MKGPSAIGRVIAGIAAAVLLLWLAGRGVDWGAVGRTMATARWAYVTLGAMAAFLATGARAWRWAELLVRGERDRPIARLWAIILMGQTINIAIPARLGEVWRVPLAADATGCTKTNVVATIALEKLLDSIVFLGILGIATLALPLPPWLARARDGFALATVVAVGCTALLARRRDRLLTVLERASRPDTLLARTRLSARLRSALDALQVVGEPAALLRLLLISIAIWGAAGYTNYLVLQALAIQAPSSAAVLLLAILQLGTAPPSTPGKVGVFQYLCILGLAPFNVSREMALGYGLLLHAVAYLPPLIIGSVLMIAEVPRWRVRT